ncbi:helix-turn-helix transcriptional regulator [Pedosphaera parvula]|uniref:DNA binding domain protein, excisionase family n=1 Tax=Pedosphaera parvula (strain Ellin514) TaxID=320771 RepID=B9XA31_PEDPL|nr:DNA binding domain protein, excisionase family [Pedosphaera parvula Ellin514]
MLYSMIEKQQTNNEPMLTKTQTAEFLQVTVRCVEVWMSNGILPYFKLGKRSVRFKKSDIEQHLNKNCRILRN